MGSHYLKDEEGNFHEYSEEEYWEMQRGKNERISIGLTTGGVFLCAYALMYGDGFFSLIFLIGAIMISIGGAFIFAVSNHPKLVLIISIALGIGAIAIIAYGKFERNKTSVTKDGEGKEANSVEMTTETPKNVDESAVDYTAVAEEEYIADEYSTDEASNEYIDEAEVQDVEKIENVKGNEVLDVVEQMPSFPGGETMLMEYFSSNIRYPEVAVENGIQGRVVVTFVVERDGSISDVEVTKSVDPSLDREAVRVTKSMPRWKAGMQNGKAVRVKYAMPVEFSLTIAE